MTRNLYLLFVELEIIIGPTTLRYGFNGINLQVFWPSAFVEHGVTGLSYSQGPAYLGKLGLVVGAGNMYPAYLSKIVQIV